MGLTVTQIRNAKPREKAYSVSDGGGLHLLIQPSGSKLWRLSYRFEGKQRTLSIGKFPDVSIADAHEVRDTVKKQLKAGIDPQAPPEPETVSGRTFKEVAVEFHQIWQTGKNKDHVDRVWGRLERDAFPLLGDKPLLSIKPLDIVNVVRKVEERGALDVSRRLKQKCGEVFGYAIAMGYATVDPTAHVNKALRPKPKVEHMPAVPVRDIPKLVAAIEGYRLSDIARLALKFTLLTATRTGEVRGATWSEVDIKGEIWRIPGNRMKMGREHLVPLSQQTLALLKEIKKHKRGEYLFPGPRRPQMNTNTMIDALYDLKMRGVQTVHGFRRLFSTVLNESGKFNKDWIEIQLAHAEENEIRASYNSAEYLEHRTYMMQWWADFLYPSKDDFEELL